MSSNFEDMEKYRDRVFQNILTRFRPIIDKLLDEGAPRKSLKLLCENFGMKPNSLQNRLSATLKYLATHETSGEHSKYKLMDYAKLKAQSMFKIGPDCVTIVPKGGIKWGEENIKEGIVVESVASAQADNATLREKVLAWLESDDKFLNLEGRKDLGGSLISGEDIEWVRKTFEGIDIEYKIGNDFLRAVKGD